MLFCLKKNISSFSNVNIKNIICLNWSESIRNVRTFPIEWKRPIKIPFHDPSKTGDGSLSLPIDMNKSPVMVEHSTEIASSVFYTFIH